MRIALFIMKPNLPFPLLIDFDGVINLYGNLAPNSKDFFEFLERHNLPAFILSNSTLRTAKDVKNFLESNDLYTNIPIMTAADATLKYIEKNYQRVSVFCVDNVKKEFEKFIDDNNPQAVVIGDMADEWTIDVLNEIFLKAHNGADIVAMHMNRYWSPEKNKFVLDAGSYISAIEYATEKKAILVGKPSPIYFQTALEMLGYPKDSTFLMLGDDMELDIIPVHKMGGKTILVLTGKTKLPFANSAASDFICSNLSDVLNVLRNFYSLN
jgi:HAD superfamily hydrolase (TIGR01450 family)